MSSRVLENADKQVWPFSSSLLTRPLLLVVLVSIAIIGPALIFGVPSNLDLSNHFRFALPFNDAVISGNLYPSWLAESNHGYGDPSFRFYPPALYYLFSASRFLIGNWYAATLAAFVFVSILGGMGMYFWSRSLMPASSAMWVGLFYALAPYHVNQLYQAVMLAEWAGCSVLPFVFGFLDRVCKNGKARDIAGFATAYAVLIFTHLPLAVIGSLAIPVYALARLDGPAKVRKVAKLALGTALGLSASALYWVTMVSEVRWIGRNEIERVASLDYRFNFLLSSLSPENLTIWWVNILALMTLLLCAPALLLCLRKASSQVRILRPVICLTAFALFMSLPLSRPIWRVLPPLQQTQFPWRWLGLVSMGASILAGAAVPLLVRSTEKFDRVRRILIVGAMCISLAFTLSHSVREAVYFGPQRFENMVTQLRGSRSLEYWTPVWAHSNPKPMNGQIEASEREVSIAAWEPEHRKFSIGAGPATEARVKTFYYPHWTATSNGQLLSTRPDVDGALLISLPSNSVSVDLDFREPPRTSGSAVASLAGALFIGGLAIRPRWRRKK